MAQITVLPDGFVLQGHDGEAILDTIRRIGYGCRYGCRRGGCGICMGDLVSGMVSYPVRVAESVIPEAERSHGPSCLLCRAVPETDVVVALREEHLRRLNFWASPPVTVVTPAADGDARETPPG